MLSQSSERMRRNAIKRRDKDVRNYPPRA